MNFSVPATTANLGPGFDSLGLSLNLRNCFSVSPSTKKEIHITGEGADHDKFYSDNLFSKIFTKKYNELGGADTFKFRFHNKIPISRGLGSSSAVIVGAIFSAYKMAGRVPIKSEVLNSAFHYEQHPDNITSAVFGGFNVSVVRCRKDKPSIINARQRMPNDVVSVIVVPNKVMPTRVSRSVLPVQYPISDAVFNVSRSSMLSVAFFSQRWDLLREASLDRLHQSYRMNNMPILSKVQKFALMRGALMSTLSGSGSSIFNLCFRNDGDALRSSLANKFPFFRVLMVDLDNDGVKVEKDFCGVA